MKALRKRWRGGRRVDAEQWQRASRGALREGSPNLRRDRGSRPDGGDGERRVRLSGGASGQDLPHSRPRRTERLSCSPFTNYPQLRFHAALTEDGARRVILSKA